MARVMVKSDFTYEDAYALRIMEFEKEQVRQRRRPPLPAQQRYVDTGPAATALREQQLETRQNMFRSILDNVGEEELVDARTLAERIGTTSQKLTNYLKPMVDEGYLKKFAMAKGSVSYLYVKTEKELVDDSEQGDFGGY